MKKEDAVWMAIPICMFIGTIIHLLISLIFSKNFLSPSFSYFLSGDLMLGSFIATMLSEYLKSKE